MQKKRKKIGPADTDSEPVIKPSKEGITTLVDDSKFLKGVHKTPSSSDEDDDDSSLEEREISIEEMQQMLMQAGAVPGQQPLIYSDQFRVVSDAFQPEFVTALELPKMILKKTRDDEQTINDKSVLMVYLSITNDNIKKGCFQQLYKAARRGPIKLQLAWLEAVDKTKETKQEPEELSLWKFEGARIKGIDFGNAMAKRADINMVTVEVTYENIIIDGISL